MRALVIEDDETVARINARILETEGFTVDIASTIQEGLRLAMSGIHEIIITDLMLPDGHGTRIVRAVREHGSTTPILVLTGVGDINSTVDALECGADDYIRKPFDLDELRARVRSLVRRGTVSGSPDLTFVNISVNRMSREVHVDGHRLELSPKEFMLLEYFMTQPSDEPISQHELLEKVWRIDFDPRTNVVAVNVARLRGKLLAAGATCRIDSERGVGYVFTGA